MPVFTNRRLAYIALLSLALLPSASWSQSEDKAQGEVRKVDRDNQKITVQHGEIKSLDMPPMTMAFTVKDPALLEAAKPGDKVRFVAVREDGKFVMKAIEVAP